MIIDKTKAITLVESIVLNRLSLIREDILSDINLCGRRVEAIQLIMYVLVVEMRLRPSEVHQFYKIRDNSFYVRHLANIKDRLVIKGNEYLKRDIAEIVALIKSNTLEIL